MKKVPKLKIKDVLSLLSFPIMKRNKTNEQRRNIKDLQQVTASQMLSDTKVGPDGPILLCGEKNKLLPFLQCFIRRASPYVVVGSGADFAGDSCLQKLPCNWKIQQPIKRLDDGNGWVVLQPDGETSQELKEYLPHWDSHLIIFCIGNGLKVDNDLLNLLDRHGRYILVAENLYRSVSDTGGNQLTPKSLMAHMDYIIVSSIGAAAKDLLEVLPTYECEKVVNATDFSFHQDGPHQEAMGHHSLHGWGGRIGQTKTIETKTILTESELIDLQDNNNVLVYNNKKRHTWVGQITRGYRQ